MKILITSTGSWGTGSFTVIEGVVHSLLELGHQVKVIFPDLTSQLPAKFSPEHYEIWKFPIEQQGVRLENFPLMITDPHPLNPTAITFKDLSQAQFDLYCSEFKREITALIDEFQPDIIESNHIWLMAYVSQVIKYLGDVGYESI